MTTLSPVALREDLATFLNPLLEEEPDFADPFALWHRGSYFAMVTEKTQVSLRRTPDLTRLRDAERRVLYVPPRVGPAARDLWAPELAYLDGQWFCYFTGVDETGEDRNRRIFVLEGPEGDDPMSGEWRFAGPLKIPVDRYAIDGTVLEDAGRRYFLWSSKLDYRGGFWQHLLIAEMLDPFTLGPTEVVLSRPDQPWECHDQPTNEGPQILQHGGTIWLGYSGSAYWSEHYAIGFLQAQSGSDLLNPASWVKQPQPYFQQCPEHGVYGPGHASFVPSPDGTEDWLFYHARTALRGEARSPRLQRITWIDDQPVLGIPASIETPLRKPSGTVAVGQNCG